MQKSGFCYSKLLRKISPVAWGKDLRAYDFAARAATVRL
jgi:hypothetical protein